MAPVAAVLLAVGAGGIGLMTGRADLAAAGAASGAAGVLLEQAASRSTRRRLRQDRTQLRGQIRDLDARLGRLNRELAGAPSVLRPLPPPAPTTGPSPVVEAADRATGPATPRSLPILTANRRGLQSCAPELPGLPVPAISGPLVRHPDLAPVAALGPTLAGVPGQRPPATPISGLHLPPVEDPDLPKLQPGPAAPMLHTAGMPRLRPGPSEVFAEHSVSASEVGDDPLELAMIGAALLAEREAGPATRSAARPRHRVAAGRGEAGGEAFVAGSGQAVGAVAAASSRPGVLDLRTVPSTRPATAVLSRRGAAAVDDLVFTAIEESTRSELELALEPGRRPASLFEPVATPRHGRHVPDPGDDAGGGRVAVDEVEMRRLAEAARYAARAMRSSPPPSPFFTPGAFDDEARTQRDSA